MVKQNLTVGELVTIRDYSWALRLGLDKCSNAGCFEPNAYQKFKVLVVGCKMPTNFMWGEQYFADTIVMGQDDNIVWLVCSRFVKKCKPTHKITIDNKTIEISDESYKELKKSLGNS